jgi:hypothetical protein
MEDRERRIRGNRRAQRFYWVALVVWLVAVVLNVTAFGGFESPVYAIGAVVIFLGLVVGIVSARMALREDSASR